MNLIDLVGCFGLAINVEIIFLVLNKKVTRVLLVNCVLDYQVTKLNASVHTASSYCADGEGLDF